MSRVAMDFPKYIVPYLLDVLGSVCRVDVTMYIYMSGGERVYGAHRGYTPPPYCMCVSSMSLLCRVMLGLAGIPSIIMFIGLIFMPKSPRWLVFHGKTKQAHKNLISVCDITIHSLL